MVHHDILINSFQVLVTNEKNVASFVRKICRWDKSSYLIFANLQNISNDLRIH